MTVRRVTMPNSELIATVCSGLTPSLVAHEVASSPNGVTTISDLGCGALFSSSTPPAALMMPLMRISVRWSSEATHTQRSS